ncbi:dihydrodipicolinate synthase family protein [Bordetella genomosp. 10]|uniref:Dihydrodipicolinate synthase family protein n=1 Tax=Bordetella genomosp. 10 TaxID=1416804 RepID=A0A261S0Z9_9BORD|nr:dihydrodipicolinate synthase family protein [Bordetella genomosp. 10]OZI31014.1 dihydrodipicolinate synthase family protein [Bordetella genomosp. 10]
MLHQARGVYIVTQTPFDGDGGVDHASIDTLVDFYLRHGADGFTVLGVAGEAAKLTADEALGVARRFIARAQGKPVIVGVSNPSIAQLRELTGKVMDAGASGVMIAPPSGSRTEEELFGYFARVFDEIGNVPTVLQDFPFSTGTWMSVPFILELVRRHPQIQVLKEEDIPSITKITRLRAQQDRRIAILTGNNAMFLPLELGRGIDGPMAGFSHPEMLSTVYRLHREGQVQAAHDVFDCYLPLLSYENQSQWGVAVRKEILRRRGAIRHAAMRKPGPALTADDLKEIDLLVTRVQRAVAERA